jgi:hypothetical protein
VTSNQNLLKYPNLQQRIKTRKNPTGTVSSEYEQNVGALIAEKLDQCTIVHTQIKQSSKT